MTTRLASLPDFRRLWFVGLVSFVVRWLEMLAIALFSYQITGSAFVVAMLSLLRLLPMGLFGAFIGAAADRFERRSALILVVALSLSTTLVIAVCERRRGSGLAPGSRQFHQRHLLGGRQPRPPDDDRRCGRTGPDGPRNVI